jgi:hypothetical protein
MACGRTPNESLLPGFAVLALAAAAILLWRVLIQVRSALAGALLVLALAGPWYARNLVVYRNVSGTHEEFDGIGFKEALAAAPRIDWVATTSSLARGSLWTGKNSFTSFSRATLNIMLFLLLVAVGAWGLRIREGPSTERIVFASVVVFLSRSHTLHAPASTGRSVSRSQALNLLGEPERNRNNSRVGGRTTVHVRVNFREELGIIGIA